MTTGGQHPSSGPANANRHFATTSWSMVLNAANAEAPDSDQALSHLCETYWYPLYAFVRRKGFESNEAQDLTQAFFAEILSSNKIAVADDQRGKFRTFLLTSLTNFIKNHWRSEQAAKRGGGQTHVAIDFADADDRYSDQPFHDLTPERIYERTWALTLLNETIECVRAQYEQSGKLEIFNALRSSLVGAPDANQKEISESLNMKEGAIKVALHRLRQRYGEQLRLQIARTIKDPSKVDDELKQLFSALAGE